MTIEQTCKTHGSYEARHLAAVEGFAAPLSSCPKCNADHIARKALEAEQEAQRQRSAKLRELLVDSCIPARFTDASLSDYETTSQSQRYVLAVCQGFVDTWPSQYRKGRSLVLTGGCGTGKTHLACALAGALIAQHLAPVLFGTAAELLRMVKGTYRRNSQTSEEQAMEMLLSPKLLIIDEIGAQHGTAHELQLLFEVVNSRYQQMLPTIIISNLNPTELENFLGERIMDRFRECGLVLAFDWESFRGKQRAST